MQRILVIDDEASVRTVIERVLERYGFEVVAADTGQAGLKILEAGPCDLVIVDIFMPGMDGLETMKRMRELRPAMPIVAISGFSFGRDSPDFLSMATKLGADYALPKPFRPAELLACLEACFQDVVPRRPTEKPEHH